MSDLPVRAVPRPVRSRGQWSFSALALPVSGVLAWGHYNGSFIGMAPQATLTWQIGPHLSWGQTLSRFMTSAALNHAGGSSGTYYMSNLSFRF